MAGTSPAMTRLAPVFLLILRGRAERGVSNDEARIVASWFETPAFALQASAGSSP
jgi:hypothetical protein